MYKLSYIDLNARFWRKIPSARDFVWLSSKGRGTTACQHRCVSGLRSSAAENDEMTVSASSDEESIMVLMWSGRLND